MKNQYLPYAAMTLLSFSLCLLGFLITPNSPHLGGLMGLLAGSSLGILLLQVTRFDHKSRSDQQKSNPRQSLGDLTQDFHVLSEQVLQLDLQHNHQIDELKRQIDVIQSREQQFQENINNVNEKINICLTKLNQPIIQTKVDKPKTRLKDTSEEQSSSQIIQWLRSYQVELVNSYSGHDADTILDQTAFFIGSNYPLLHDVLHKIRQSLSCDHFGFRVNLTNEPEQRITAVTNLGTKLKSIGFLSYTYQRQGGRRTAHIRTLDSNGTQFLTGEWLERYAYQVVTKIFEQKGLEYEALMNVIIKDKDGTQSEIDLLCFVKEKPLWIECKVANCEEFISRYSRFAKLFNLNPQQIFLVVLDMPREQAQTLTDIHHVQVVTPDEVPDAIEHTLQVFDGAKPVRRAVLSSSESGVNEPEVFYRLGTPMQLQSFLIAAGLRPLPKDRERLIQTLIERVSSQTSPQTISHIKTDLYASLNEDVSRSKISEFLRICLKSGCFLDPNHQVVKDFRTPVSDLISQDWRDLEDKCVEGIASRLLIQDAHYFQSADKCSHFQSVVGAAPPRTEPFGRAGGGN